MKQYYSKNNSCTAESSNSPDCICWHDEGTGPYFGAIYTDPKSGKLPNTSIRSWRDKPNTKPMKEKEPIEFTDDELYYLGYDYCDSIDETDFGMSPTVFVKAARELLERVKEHHTQSQNNHPPGGYQYLTRKPEPDEMSDKGEVWVNVSGHGVVCWTMWKVSSLTNSCLWLPYDAIPCPPKDKVEQSISEKKDAPGVEKTEEFNIKGNPCKEIILDNAGRMNWAEYRLNENINKTKEALKQKEITPPKEPIFDKSNHIDLSKMKKGDTAITRDGKVLKFTCELYNTPFPYIFEREDDSSGKFSYDKYGNFHISPNEHDIIGVCHK